MRKLIGHKNLRGILMTPIQYKVSIKGTPYATFVLKPESGDAVGCIAFQEHAIYARDHLDEQRLKISCYGKFDHEDKFIINKFDRLHSVVTEGGERPKRLTQAYKPANPELEWIMDVLSPAYVTRRMRDWLASCGNERPNTPSGTRGTILGMLRSFDVAGYKKLYGQLKAEAQERVTAMGIRTFFVDGKGTSLKAPAEASPDLFSETPPSLACRLAHDSPKPKENWDAFWDSDSGAEGAEQSELDLRDFFDR